jgi:hypothetical protein
MIKAFDSGWVKEVNFGSIADSVGCGSQAHRILRGLRDGGNSEPRLAQVSASPCLCLHLKIERYSTSMRLKNKSVPLFPDGFDSLNFGEVIR